jgi:aspartokinase
VILPYAQIDGPQTRISPRIEADHDRAATLIADIANLVLVRMADGEKQIPQALAKALVEHRITHHVIPTDRGMSVAVKAEKYRDIPAMVTDTIAARALPARLSRGQWALVSAVGQRVGQPEITARAEKALQRADITPSGTAVGSMSISYLVRDTERKPAVVALHKELIRS